MKEKKRKKKRVIPGFGLSFGITIAMLGFIPFMYPCDILGKAVVYGIYNDSYKAESAFKLQSKSSDSVNRSTYRRSYGNNSCMGSCKIQLSG